MLYYDGQTGTHCSTIRPNAMRKSCSKLLNVSFKICRISYCSLYSGFLFGLFVRLCVCYEFVSHFGQFLVSFFCLCNGFPSHLEVFRISWFLVKYTTLSYTILYIGMNLRNTILFWKQMWAIKSRVWVIYENKWGPCAVAVTLFYMYCIYRIACILRMAHTSKMKAGLLYKQRTHNRELYALLTLLTRASIHT